MIGTAKYDSEYLNAKDRVNCYQKIYRVIYSIPVVFFMVIGISSNLVNIEHNGGEPVYWEMAVALNVPIIGSLLFVLLSAVIWHFVARDSFSYDMGRIRRFEARKKKRY